MKRLLSIVLCALLVLSVPALAENSESAYRQLYSGEVTTLNYLITATTNEFAIAANVIDTLVEYDSFGQVQPSLAESWDVSDDGLTWTFHIRQGATWVDYTGAYVADVTANDFVTAAQYVLNAQNASSTADVLLDFAHIVGANEYYLGTSTPEEGQEAYPVTEWDTVGIKAMDDYTLVYTLSEPTPYFLSMTTYVCFMPVYEPFLTEKGADFGLATGPDTLLYNGAYIISEFKPQEIRVLTKNASNWDADNVTIDKLVYTYNAEASTISPELLLRGEVDSASITTAIASEWLADPEKADLIRPVRVETDYSYFYAFNFDPQFDAAYEPENWTKAVNNENFRKSLYYGLDRVKAKTVTEPDNPEMLLSATVTLPGFASADGVDYTTMGELAPYTATDVTELFDADAAIAARDAAVAELTQEGATFPVKVLMCYNPSSSTWAEECQVVEQQLEGLLGADYIDIIVEAGPSSGFLKEIRRSGKYAFMKCNWGADYADPVTFTDPFTDGNTYNFIYRGAPELSGQYDALVKEANAIVSADKTTERYLALAKAEAFLIDHAIIVPYGTDNGGYTADRIDPFSTQYASFGISTDRYKGATLLDAPMSTDQFYDAYDAWMDAMTAE